MLVPRELDMIAAGRHMPLPVPKPTIAEVEVDKTDGKGKANSVKAGEIVAGKHMPSPPKPKVPEIEVKKRDSKGRANSANSGEDWRAAARSGRQAAPARTDYRL